MIMQCKHLKYEVIFEALKGETDCGDQYLVKELNNSILIAVADGLGHGSEAAVAAKKAMVVLDTHANEPIDKLIKICDQELAETRGAALTLMRIDENCMLSYLGVGNVAGACWQFDEIAHLNRHSFYLERGIVGCQLPSSMQVRNITIKPGDIFIVATDGINEKFETELLKLGSSETIAKYLFKKYRNSSDDGLMLAGKII